MKPRFFFSHAVRAKEIIGVLARHGFADLLDHFDLPAGIRRRLPPKVHPGRTGNERIRLALEELGPTAVKIGQLLSMRPDVLPAPLILELRKLQCEVRPVPFEEIKPVLAEEFGTDLEQVFREFRPVPVASASIAQVYFARLRSDGRSVAVKVQRPSIARTIQIDLDFASWFAGQIHQRVSALQPYDLPAVMQEIREAMKRELDFGSEARNQQYFNTINPFPDRVFAPGVVADLSGRRVLVMDWIDGLAPGRAVLLPAQAKALAADGARSVVHQILVAGYFHADPHGGNLLVTPDGRLCFLDWGQVGHLTKRLRYALADFWVAAVDQDAERIVQIAISLAPAEARLEARVMEKEVTLALREELNFVLGRQQIGRAMLKLLYIFGRQGIMLSRDYSLMAKAVLSIEEIGRVLDPGFDLREQAGPILAEVARERTSPRNLVRRAREFARSSLATLHDLPGELHRLMRRLEHDDFTIKLQHQGLHALDEGMRTAANRIALGVMIGSLIIGSSIIVATHLPPLFHGYSALGITGYVLSATLGFYVIWDIIRHGRHK